MKKLIRSELGLSLYEMQTPDSRSFCYVFEVMGHGPRLMAPAPNISIREANRIFDTNLSLIKNSIDSGLLLAYKKLKFKSD